jgi:hypothetical protein
MTDRKLAWADWNKGRSISDENLLQVREDLKTVDKIFRASGMGGFAQLGVTMQLQSMDNMFELRQRERSKTISSINTD